MVTQEEVAVLVRPGLWTCVSAPLQHWGYYSKTLKPSIVINSGDTITVEMITHHAGDYYDGADLKSSII